MLGLRRILATSFSTLGGHPDTSAKPQVTFPRPIHRFCPTTSVHGQGHHRELGGRWFLSSRHCSWFGSYKLKFYPRAPSSRFAQDDQIHFGHPIIASTTKLFYFDKWHEISTHDQETFRGAVPKPLVALIGVVVSPIRTEFRPATPLTIITVQEYARRVGQRLPYDCQART